MEPEVSDLNKPVMTAKIERPIYLSGATVFLRDLNAEDVSQDYVNWMNDPEVMKCTESRFVTHDLDSIKNFVRLHERSENSVLLGIFSQDNRLHLGNIKLGPIQWQHGLGDIGLIVGRKSFWGRGIASEAIPLLCDYAFSSLKLHKLTANCYASNKGSAKAFLKAGFDQEGMRLLHVKGESGWEDVLEFGRINQQGIGNINQ